MLADQMPRNDPTDTGGLFIGRRPGTGPLHYRTAPSAAVRPAGGPTARWPWPFFCLETLLCLTLWGPQPLAWLWVGSQVDYRTGSVTAGIAAAFAGMVATLMLTLAACARLDRAWQILRRAAGHEQRDGALVRIFATTAVVAGVVFAAWFLIIQGPAPPPPSG
jgi:hypothetical protein